MAPVFQTKFDETFVVNVTAFPEQNSFSPFIIGLTAVGLTLMVLVLEKTIQPVKFVVPLLVTRNVYTPESALTIFVKLNFEKSPPTGRLFYTIGN